MPTAIDSRISATHADLPAAVATALAEPVAGESTTIDAAGVPFHVDAWGEAGARPLLLVHGVTSTSRTWWRIGPALAAAGFRVAAPDLPGHGLTRHWTGHHRFRETAADLCALVRAMGWDGPALSVVGHSWGAMTAAALPASGLEPRVLVLLDPPTIPLASIAAMLDDPLERFYDDLDEAIRAIGRANPTWTYGDVLAKAEGLNLFDESAVRAVLTENGDWDGGLADLADPRAGRVETWLVRGDPAGGGLVPDATLPAFAARLGEGRVLTIDGAPHSPQRTHPEATLVALLRTLV